MRALSPEPAPDWVIRSSLSQSRGRAAQGTAWDRRARCARVPGARARSRVSRGGRSRAVSRRSSWRRRRRRRLAVGRGRGLRDSEVAGGSGVSGFFIPRLEGGPPEGCRPGRAEERLGRADRPPPGRGGKGRTRGRGAAAVLINRSPGARRGRGGGARTPLRPAAPRWRPKLSPDSVVPAPAFVPRRITVRAVSVPPGPGTQLGAVAGHPDGVTGGAAGSRLAAARPGVPSPGD